jgi:hypothetical protein
LSAVDFAAVAHAIDADGFGIGVGKANAPIPNAEPVFGWVNPLKLFDIACIGLKKALDGCGNAQSNGPVKPRQIGSGLICEYEPSQEGSL